MKNSISDYKNEFLEYMILSTRDETKTLIKKTLNDDIKSIRKIVPELIEMNKFFKSLSKENKRMIYELIDYTVKLLLFGVLVKFDGHSGGNVISDVESDFAIYLQSYENNDDKQKNKYLEKIRINTSQSDHIELHDLMMMKFDV